MKVWLQSSDFSSKEYELNLHQSIKLFREHDWQEERELGERLDAAGEENCPAGMGLIHESGRILHICPETMSAIYHIQVPRKFLGLIPNGTRTITHEDYNLANIPGLLTSYFNAEWEQIE